MRRSTLQLIVIWLGCLVVVMSVYFIAVDAWEHGGITDGRALLLDSWIGQDTPILIYPLSPAPGEDEDGLYAHDVMFGYKTLFYIGRGVGYKPVVLVVDTDRVRYQIGNTDSVGRYYGINSLYSEDSGETWTYVGAATGFLRSQL